MNSSAKPTNSTTASAPTEEEDLLAEFDHLFSSDAEPDLAALANVPPLTVDDIALDELLDGLESQMSALDAPIPPPPPHLEPVVDADEPLADFNEPLAEEPNTPHSEPLPEEHPNQLIELIEDPLEESLEDPLTSLLVADTEPSDPMVDSLDTATPEPEYLDDQPADSHLPSATTERQDSPDPTSPDRFNDDHLDTDLLESLLNEQESPAPPATELPPATPDTLSDALDFDLETLLQDHDQDIEPRIAPVEEEPFDDLEPLTDTEAPEQALDELLADDPLEDLDQLLEELDGAEVLPPPTEPNDAPFHDDPLSDDPLADLFDEPITTRLSEQPTAPLTASDDLDDIGELDSMSSNPSPNRDDLTTDTDDAIADLDDLLQEHELNADDFNHLDNSLLDDLEESEDLDLDLELDNTKPQNSAAAPFSSEDDLDQLDSLIEEESNDFALEGKSEERLAPPPENRPSAAASTDNDMDNLDELDNLLDDDLDLDDTDLDLAAGLNSRDREDSNDLLDDLIDTSAAAAPIAAVAATAAAAAATPTAAAAAPPPTAAAEPKTPPAKPSASAEPPKDAKEGKPVSKLQLAIIGAALAINLIIGGLAFYYASRLSGDIHQTTTQVDTLKEDLEASYTREIPEVVENRSNINLLDKRVNTLSTSVDSLKGFKNRTEEELSGLQQRYDEISTVVTEQQKEQEAAAAAAAARQKEEAAKKRLAEAKQRKAPATQTATQTAAAEPKKPKPTGWVINLATMASESQAKQAKQQLAQAGMTAMIQKITVNKKSHYRVQVGNYKTRDEATLNALNLPDQPEFDRAWVGMAE